LPAPMNLRDGWRRTPDRRSEGPAHGRTDVRNAARRHSRAAGTASTTTARA
jgi:hypothetical protein